MKVNHATINNAEVVLNALFLHNIPYHANNYDIEYVLKPLIHIKELILFLDSNNQFKGCAKLLVEKKEDFQKLLTYSGKLKLFNRFIFINKFIHKNKISQPNNEKKTSEILDKNKNKNNVWFEKKILNNNKINKNNKKTQSNFIHQEKTNKINKNLTNKIRNKNRKISKNQIVIFNLPNKINQEFLKKLFKEYKILEIIILNNKNNNQKFSFVTFQNEDLRDKALSLNGIFIYKKKIFIKKAFEKKNFKKKNITPTNNINNNFNEILEKRIINLENEIKKLKLIIDNNSNSIINLNKNSENKINKNFEKGVQTQKRNPKTNYKEKNKNKNENYHYEEKSIEIDIEKEDDVNKSKNKIINKQKNNKPSLADFFLSIGQTITKQKPNFKPFSFTNNFKKNNNFHLPNTQE
ncbi:transformer-2 sex-determining protein [Anaeramoeba flamelloides]|uniref:Transformer-2 sex-determining protein n=1 Tax=Anaeramoeba flamelloides TaxID=1746091 RepID=A0AAV7ZHQ6_9EUKA|nr:transformer-2 sex-determining protein [Anaeramoeba flamelloides]